MYVGLGSCDREHPLSGQYPYATSSRTGSICFSMRPDCSSCIYNCSASEYGYRHRNEELHGRNKLPNGWCGTDFRSKRDGSWICPGEGTKRSRRTDRGGMVTFNTNRATSGSGTSCSSPLGEARGYWVNLLNASGSFERQNRAAERQAVRFVGGGLTPSPPIARVVVNGQTETVVIGAAQRSGGASSGIAPQQVEPVISSARKIRYWKTKEAD